ncbi:MAG: hypothetical protein H6741_09685 [Alphaproteobacteria bacterium]|nr:hypothetical protein [Alphaproteobacteria bacterium]MCB9792982.1 hypothetical protein [Alphaproteobacteria bacterium]
MLASLALLGTLFAAEPEPVAEAPPAVEPARPFSLIDTSGQERLKPGARWASLGASSAGCFVGGGLGVLGILGVATAAPDTGRELLTILSYPLAPAGCALGAGGAGRLVNGRSLEKQVQGALVGELIAVPVFIASALVTVSIYDASVYTPYQEVMEKVEVAVLILPSMLTVGAWTSRVASRAPLASPRMLPVADVGGGAQPAPGLVLQGRW